MISRCKQVVFNNSKPVLFKTTEYAKLSAAYKAFFCCGWGWCFVQGKEERV